MMAKLSEVQEKQRWGFPVPLESGFPCFLLGWRARCSHVAPQGAGNHPLLPCSRASPYLMVFWDERVSLVCTEWNF